MTLQGYRHGPFSVSPFDLALIRARPSRRAARGAYFLGTYDRPRVVLFCLAAWAGAGRCTELRGHLHLPITLPYSLPHPSFPLRPRPPPSSVRFEVPPCSTLHGPFLSSSPSLASILRPRRRSDTANSPPVRSRESSLCRNGAREIEGFAVGATTKVGPVNPVFTEITRQEFIS